MDRSIKANKATICDYHCGPCNIQFFRSQEDDQVPANFQAGKFMRSPEVWNYFPKA